MTTMSRNWVNSRKFEIRMNAIVHLKMISTLSSSSLTENLEKTSPTLGTESRNESQIKVLLPTQLSFPISVTKHIK